EADYRAREEMRAADEKAKSDQIAANKLADERALSIAKEKNQTRSNVQELLNSLDKNIAELARGTKESKAGDDPRGLQAFKETLYADLGSIDAANDVDWSGVKARVEKNIDAAKKRI